MKANIELTMMRLLTAVLLSVGLAGVLHAQNTLTGKWQGKTPNGYVMVLDLKVSKDKLTGTLNRNGESSPITEGKVTKDSFSFHAVANNQAEAFSGTAGPDEIKIWQDRTGPERSMVLKRIKD